MQQYSIQAIFFTLMFVYASCILRVNTPPPASKHNASDPSTGLQPKIIKNHFITKYPDDFFSIRCGLQDKAGNMWFGSMGDGIYYYDGKTFTNFTRKDGLCHNDVLCCLEDKSGMIWFGTRRGLMRYKPTGRHPEKSNFKSISIFAHTEGSFTEEQLPYEHLIANNFVWSILQDKTGRLWFSTDKGIYTCNPSDEIPVFKHFLTGNAPPINYNNLHLKDVSDMLEDKNGNIWFVSGYIKGEGICLYDGKYLTNFKPDSIGSYHTILERKNGNLLFLSTFNGIYSYDGSAFANLTVNLGINASALNTMLEDKNGNLWFSQDSSAMKGSGVWLYDGKHLRLFTTKEGLCNNAVFCMIADKNGNIWFGTSNTGLCRFDGKSFTNFTE